MEDTYGIQSRIGSIIVVERWYCCRGSPVFSDRNIHLYCKHTSVDVNTVKGGHHYDQVSRNPSSKKLRIQ